MLKFNRLRVGKTNQMKIVLKNDGQVPATIKFDTTQHDSFRFLSHTSYTLAPKTY